MPSASLLCLTRGAAADRQEAGGGGWPRPPSPILPMPIPFTRYVYYNANAHCPSPAYHQLSKCFPELGQTSNSTILVVELCKSFTLQSTWSACSSALNPDLPAHKIKARPKKAMQTPRCTMCCAFHQEWRFIVWSFSN